MKRQYVRIALVLTALVCALALLTACGDSPKVVIEDVPTETVPTTSPDTTVTAVSHIVAEGQMTLNDLMGLMGGTLTWDTIAGFDHTDISDTKAEFSVADNEGRTCTMTVTYDPATGAISEATLQSGDVTEDVLSGETAIIRRILVAMNQQAAAE